MEKKTVIVTGANRGIGKETALELARKGARIILACRNLEAASLAREEIIAETGNSQVVVKLLDVSCLKSVREFAEEFNRTEQRLDVLIHNAGVIPNEVVITEEGLERTMATNHFGPFLLTHLLIDLMKKSTPSRIIVVSSIAYLMGTLSVTNINPKSCIYPCLLYFRSKYANVCFTLELARRLEGSGVTANCLHPGLVDTDIWKSFPWWSQSLVKAVKGFFFCETGKGSETSVYLACSQKVEGVSGKFFADCKEWWVWKGLFWDGEWFWEASKKWAKITEDDPQI